ncbi:fumarylacetoacetate hydrolase family protein [Arthrobacter sp. M4]|uniref:fumarylacetoacetate hydrolase family protein n=1 Tax=Arthrobacter sp. M4 TaxID=218160 RepID=UPI001CDD22F5|nr:fumarylacetoacetate hydrolase [Arthrobacter sp. M4]MCA4134517.1 fumarylacetoacetate hydrolase [Arthrobacter sp. M4]
MRTDEEYVQQVLPIDAEQAVLVGRVWDPVNGGPRVAAVHGADVYDLQEEAPTVAGLLAASEPAAVVRAIVGRLPGPRWQTAELLRAAEAHDRNRPHFLAPTDLQVVKACGVTFVDSMIERVIEERAGGDPRRAAELRERVGAALGGSLADVRPGSPEADRAKAVFQAEGLWSQYLEVGIGKDPEVFTKAPVLASVGYGAGIGILGSSEWNNPEPELVLLVSPDGRPVGATLGNDVNLRDIEGRSALLLGKAKDNNASSALGPFIRLFDDTFTLDSLRNEDILLDVLGPDGFRLEGRNSLSRISRPFEELIAATVGPHHQYPDGFALYTGTLFAPVQDRAEAGRGFTHCVGDRVEISSPKLGTLANVVARCDELPPWEYGLGEFIAYLSRSARVGLPAAPVSG